MADMVTAQELENAKIDARTIGESVNENKIVTPRYGAPFKSMPMIAEEMQSVIGTTIIGGGVPASIVADASGLSQQQVNDNNESALFDRYTKSEMNSALSLKANQLDVDVSLALKADKSDTLTKSEVSSLVLPKADTAYVDAAVGAISTDASKQYATLALANADIVNIALNKNIFVSEAANGGYWYKATAGATSLTKSPYDPLTQAKADATAKVSSLELKTLEALYGRYGIAKSLDNTGSATSSSSSAQAVITWESIKQNNDIATNINGLFVAVKLDVSGATYPSTNNDSAVFIDPLRVQIFEESTNKGTYAFTRLSTTDVWYYKNEGLTLSNITQIKIFAKPVAGVTITLSQASINVEGGFGNPEIAARNKAIQENTTYEFESYLLSLLQDNKNLLGSNVEGTSVTTLQLINPIDAQIKKYSTVCIIETDGTYSTSNSSSAGFQARIETINASNVTANSAFLKRIGNSKVWYVKDATVKSTDVVSVKIRATKPADGTYVRIKNAVITENSLPNPLYQLINSATSADTIMPKISPSVNGLIDVKLAGLEVVAHPTTAFEAIAQAATRRVDIVALGDSNQYMDGYGFDFALRDALTARFGLYATPPLTGGAYGTQTGATDTQKSKALAGIPYNYVESGTVTGSGANGLFAGQSSENQLYKLNPSAKLRCHFAYSTFAAGSGSFNVGARLEVAPYMLLGSTGPINTNTGAETYQLSSFDVATGDRSGKQLGFRFANVNQTLTAPFLSYFMRVEDADKNNGICFSTIYGRGGQSLWDMCDQMYSWSMQELTNYFSEIRRLQLSKNQSPIVVVYINSGLNDQNETSSPSWGWRESTDGKSTTAYLDNLEALAKRISDVWQFNGWDEKELFFWINPSHPTSTPDAAKLKSFRKAAFSFAGQRSRVSVVDFENLTSEIELTANAWYREPTDHNHLKLAGYKALSQRVINLIK